MNSTAPQAVTIAYCRPGRDRVERVVVLGDPAAIAARVERLRAAWPSAAVEVLDAEAAAVTR